MRKSVILAVDDSTSVIQRYEGAENYRFFVLTHNEEYCLMFPMDNRSCVEWVKDKQAKRIYIAALYRLSVVDKDIKLEITRLPKKAKPLLDETVQKVREAKLTLNDPLKLWGG